MGVKELICQVRLCIKKCPLEKMICQVVGGLFASPGPTFQKTSDKSQIHLILPKIKNYE